MCAIWKVIAQQEFGSKVTPGIHQAPINPSQLFSSYREKSFLHNRVNLFVVAEDSYTILNSRVVGLDSVARRQEHARNRAVDSQAREVV